MDMVDAQQARRVLDRLVGYKLSPLLWKKISFGLSAGRVQSAALRLIVEKERERQAFKIENYFTFIAEFTGSNEKFISNLFTYNDKKIVTKNKDKNVFLITKKEDAEQIVKESLEKEYSISKITESETNKNPYPPFTTSTLQQAGSNVYGFSASRTMKAAQKLYEHGLITYHRTDSVALSSKFLGMAKDYILKNFGEKYYDSRGFKNKSKNAQEAHEAIRPTNLSTLPVNITLGKDEANIYGLIYTRSIATQMTPIKSLSTSLDIKSSDGIFLYRTTGSRVLFDGWSKIYKTVGGVKYNPLGEDVILPKLNEGQPLKINESKFEEKNTQPPARYSEASLIKTLEKYGIGRPSTYAPTIQTIIARKYVEKVTKYLVPTDLGFVVIKLLEDNFNSIVDYNFTAGVEEDLDNVAKGEKDWTKIVGDFYKPFIKKIEEADGNLKRNDYTVLDKAPKNIKCPDCGGEMIVKLGKLGRFYSCANFPTCKGIRFLNGETNADVEKKVNGKEFKEMYLTAPKTEDGRDYVLKQGRYGMFWAHPDYPKVKDARPLEMTKAGLIKLYGEIPKTSDGREFTFRQGKFGKYWAHPEYPTVKETIRIKEPKKEEETEEN